MRKMLLLIGVLAFLAAGAAPQGAQAFFLDNETVIESGATDTYFFIADYYNVTGSVDVFEDHISINNLDLRADAEDHVNITVTNYSAAYRSLLLVNSSFEPNMSVNASGFTVGSSVNLTADDSFIEALIVNASGSVNFLFVNATGSQTLITLKEVAAADVTAPVFTNVANHTHTVNTSFSYDIDATDDAALDSFTLNGTNFTIDITTGVMANATPLNQTWTEWLNVTVNDTTGNTAWEIFFINITAAPLQTKMGLIVGLLLDDGFKAGGAGQDKNIFAWAYIKMRQDFDSAMPNGTIYHSLDAGALVYKDPDGAVHELY